MRRTTSASCHGYLQFLLAKSLGRFLLPISSRQIDESISIADFFCTMHRTPCMSVVTVTDADETMTIDRAAVVCSLL